MWDAISFYDILSDLNKEDVKVIADECYKIASIFPLNRLLKKEFYLNSIETQMLGINLLTLMTVCTDILTDSKQSLNAGGWLPLSKHISEIVH